MVERLDAGLRVGEAQNWQALIRVYENALRARPRGEPETAMYLQIGMLWWKKLGNLESADEYWKRIRKAEPAHPAMLEFYRRHVEIIRGGVGRAGGGPAGRREALAEQVARMTYDEILKRRVAFGTAASLVDRLAEIRDELGLTGIVIELNPGGLLSVEQMRRTLRILTHEVMPALQ